MSGLVVMETMKTFKIITSDNKLLSKWYNIFQINDIIAILKQNITFLVEVLGKNIKMYGCHFLYRVRNNYCNKESNLGIAL